MKVKKELPSASRTGAAYIRVSTDDQMELSPESQLSEILKYAADHKITIPSYNIFIEKEGRSGKRAENRPEFQRMIASAKSLPRPFDTILVWKFSRFARNQDESTFYKGMLRKKLSIDIVSVSEPIMEGMYGRLIEMIIEWQDEFYSYNLGMEVMRGMRENALRGAYQAPPPLGYQYQGKGTVPTIIPEEAALVKAIFSLYLCDMMKPAAIADELNRKGAKTKKGNPFTARGIKYILGNPFYTGDIRWNKAPHGSSCDNPEEDIIVTPGKHAPIIERSVFAKAARTLSRQDACCFHDKPCRHFLSGILMCSGCGCALSYHNSKKGSFQCWKYAKGLHAGSSYLSETDAVKACLSSLTQLAGDSTCVFAFLSDISISHEKKSIFLRSLLHHAVYDRATSTVYFYYYF